MRTKLNSMLVGPTPPPADAVVRARVLANQQKSKTYTDERRRANESSFKEGDMVRVKNPLHVKKGEPKFGKPTKIMKKAGQSTYVLEDGRKWNAIHLSLFPDSACAGDITQPVRG